MASSIKTSISDLDAAIRTLEVSTNPKLRRPCNCNASRHPLLTSAPNCLNCGKIICVKEGFGPCTFCGQPLLSSDETQAMIRALREERGREKMEANNAAHKRADVAKKPSSSSSAASAGKASGPTAAGPAAEALSAAEQHRDRLLGYQATSARRTRIIDEAADFETPAAGGASPWASPQERALQLKRQQRVLREQAWQARPEYEKRRVVVAIDLAGRKVTREMRRVERPVAEDDDDDDEGPEEEEAEAAEAEGDGPGTTGGGAFSRNPLLGGLVRPTYPVGKTDGEAAAQGRAGEGEASQKRRDGVDAEARRDDGARAPLGKWRRVQDDFGDNERVILDGGGFGGADDPIVA